LNDKKNDNDHLYKEKEKGEKMSLKKDFVEEKEIKLNELLEFIVEQKDEDKRKKREHERDSLN